MLRFCNDHSLLFQVCKYAEATSACNYNIHGSAQNKNRSHDRSHGHYNNLGTRSSSVHAHLFGGLPHLLRRLPDLKHVVLGY